MQEKYGEFWEQTAIGVPMNCNFCMTQLRYSHTGFHHSVAVLPLPFHRSAVVKYRCSVKIT